MAQVLDHPCPRQIAWMGVSLTVPRDWNIVRHSIQTRKGGLSFVDRYCQRLQLRWTQCRRSPLIDRMFDDHRRRQREQDSEAHFERFKHGSGFDILQRHFDDGQVINRAARYDKPTQRLIEAVMLCQNNDPTERILRDEVLQSIRVTGPAEQARHWRGFGLDATIPENYRPVQCEVKAADAMIAFRHFDPKPGADPGLAKARAEKATLGKIGMADAWDHRHLEKILLANHKKQTFDLDRTVLNHDHTGEGRLEATTATSIEPGPRLKRFFSRLRTRRDLLWHSPQANAVFHITTLSYDKAPLEPRDFILQPAMDGVVSESEQ